MLVRYDLPWYKQSSYLGNSSLKILVSFCSLYCLQIEFLAVVCEQNVSLLILEGDEVIFNFSFTFFFFFNQL